MSHSFYSPSKGAMWMGCPGALAMPENQSEEKSSEFADDGTVSHSLAAWTLDDPLRNCVDYPINHISLNGKRYEIDEERIARVQSYVDDVRRSAMGGILWAEHRVDLSRYLGMAVCPTCKGDREIGDDGGTPHTCPTCQGDGEVPQGGTSDAVIILPQTETLIVGDLKDGAGEKVYASYIHKGGIGDGLRFPNEQTALYGLGVLEDVLLLGYKIKRVILRIYQPRLNHVDEFETTAEALLGEFAERVTIAKDLVSEALTLPVSALDQEGLLKPANKTCRWCRAAARCPARRRHVQETTRHEFGSEEPPVVPESLEHLAEAFAALPLIEQWVRETKAAIRKNVQAGKEVLGTDGQPLKFVEGKAGDRAWDPEKLLSGEVEGVLAGQLGPKAYEPQQPITAPAAAKLLDKKATKAVWKAIFEPMIKRARGAPQLALGSDPRPTYGGPAQANEFANEDIGVE